MNHSSSNPNPTFGSLIKTLRERELKLSQDEFAGQVGISRNTLINWEKGKTLPKDKEGDIDRIVTNLNLDPNWEDGLRVAVGLSKIHGTELGLPGEGAWIYTLSVQANTVVISNKGQAEQEKREREARLRARLDKDRDRLLEDRLKSFAPGSRQKELIEVKQLIQTQLENPDRGGYIIITGDAGQGKTSLVARLIDEEYPEAPHHFIPFNPTTDHQITLLQSLMAALALKHSFLSDLWTEVFSRSSLAGSFSNMLEELSKHGQQTVIFIDGLDQIRPDSNIGQRDLGFLPLNLPKGIVIVVSSRPDDTLQPLKVGCPTKPYRLSSLSIKDFSFVLAHRDVKLNTIQLEELHRAVGGNAFDLDFAAQELRHLPKAEIVELIQRIKTNPKNALFDQSFSRLRQNGNEWKTVLRPLLGYLLAAVKTEALAEEQLIDVTNLNSDEVSQGLEKLRTMTGSADRQGRATYYLYHLKLIDYLQSETNQSGQRIFSSSEIRDFHAKLTEWCEKDGAELWQDSNDFCIQTRRRYARQHYITHLYYSNNWLKLSSVLDTGEYGVNKTKYFDPSTHAYAQDLEWGRQITGDPDLPYEEALKRLPYLWRYSLLKNTLVSLADHYPIEFFEALFWLGRQREALGQIELLSDPVEKVKALTRLTALTREQKGAGSEYNEVITRAYIAMAQVVQMDDSEIQIWEKLLEVTDLRTAGLWQQSLKVVEIIEDEIFKDRFLAKLAEGLVAVELTDTALKTTQDIVDEDYRAIALSEIASALVKKGQYNQALYILSSIQEIECSYPVKLISKVTTQLVQLGQVELALSTIRKLLYQSEQAEVLGKIASYLFLNDQTELAKDVYNQAITVVTSLEDEAQQNQALDEIATSMLEANQIELALKVTSNITNNYWQTEVFSKIAHQLVKIGQNEWAISVLGQLLKTFQSDLSVQGCTILGETAILCNQLNQLEMAIAALNRAYSVCQRLIDEKDKALVLGKVSSYALQIGQTKLGRDCFEQALATSQYITTSFHKTTTLGKIATEFLKVRQPDFALLTAQEITDEYQRNQVLKEIINYFLKDDKHQEALFTAKSINEKGTQFEALEQVASYYARTGQAETAITILFSISDSYTKIKIINGLVDEFMQAEQLDYALALAKSVTEDYYKAEPLARIANHLARTGKTKLAEDILYQLLKFAKAFNEGYGKSLALSDIAIYCAEMEKPLLGLNLALLIDEHYQWYKIKALNQIMIKFFQTGHVEKALTIFEQVYNIILKVDNLSFRATLLSTVAKILIQNGQNDLTLNIFNEAIDVANKSDTQDENLRAINTIIRDLLEVGQTEFAISLIEKVVREVTSFTDTRKRSEALQDLAVGFALACQFDRAITTAQSITEGRERIRALTAIADQAFQVNKLELAKQLLNDALQIYKSDYHYNWGLERIVAGYVQIGLVERAFVLANQVDDKGEKAQILSEIATQIAQNGQTELAYSTFEEAISLTKNSDSFRIGSLDFSEIIENLAQVGYFDLALTVANQLNDEREEDADTLGILAIYLAEAGEVEPALTTANRISSHHINKNRQYNLLEALKIILGILVNNHTQLDFSKALSVIRNQWLIRSNARSLLESLSLSNHFLIENGTILEEILNSFEWVEQFIQKI